MKPKPSKPGKSGAGKCGACHHARRDMIDMALVCGTSHNTIAQRFDLSADCISRHARNHLSAQLRAAIMSGFAPEGIDLETLQKSESESLLASLIRQRARLSSMAESAIEHNLPNVAVNCERGILANLELTSRLLGQLVHRSEVTTRSFLVTADYLKFRSILVEELKGHPQLAARIASRIASIETEAAETILAKPAPRLIEVQSLESPA
jgi:hypothetical protein